MVLVVVAVVAVVAVVVAAVVVVVVVVVVVTVQLTPGAHASNGFAQRITRCQCSHHIATARLVLCPQHSVARHVLPARSSLRHDDLGVDGLGLWGETTSQCTRSYMHA